MAIGLLDAAVLAVNHKFRPLILAHLSAEIDCILFFVKVLDRFFAAAFFYIPAAA